jgi:hypothetical protein
MMEIVNRTLTELCIEAQRELIEKHGYSPEDFSAAEGTETLYDGYGEPMDPHPLKGAPLYWYRRHAENAWSCMLASHLLESLQPDIESGTTLL